MTDTKDAGPIRRKKRFNWHEFRVGIFVIGSFAILIFMIFRVSGGRGFFTPKVMAVSYLPTISGLKIGAPVWLNGIEIGNVESFTLEPTLPNTTANQQTLEKIRRIENDISRYEQIIQELEGKIDSQRNRLTLAQEKEKPALNVILREQEGRLSGMQRTLDNLREDLKSRRDNIQSIRLLLKIEKEYENWIKRDSELTIGSIGLLGDKYVDISIGRTEIPARKNPAGSIIIEGLNEATIREMMLGANDLLANFGDISERVKSIVAKLDAGEGTIGQLINDASLHQSLITTLRNLDTTVQGAGTVMTDIHQSQGTFGKLINDKELYVQLEGTVKEMKDFVQRLNQSEGTINRLIRDPELYNNMKDLTARIDHIMTSIDQGRGTLGKLTVDDSLYLETRESLQRLRSILSQIDEGQGTVGQLLKDRQLYENLNSALSELSKLIYDIRKNPKTYLRIKFSMF